MCFWDNRPDRLGSPPLTWRTHELSAVVVSMTGITSTYVENTPNLIAFHSFNKDHLHLRGEHRFLLFLVPWRTGSPPLTWRTLYLSKLMFWLCRITSTYVENTQWKPTKLCLTWDHLHLRGEHSALYLRQGKSLGSPPLTWRTLNKSVSDLSDTGITSTYVENTATPKIIITLARDHLHLRGEHHNFFLARSSLTGSPPLTWRTHCKTTITQDRIRITSTYVENTLCGFWCSLV